MKNTYKQLRKTANKYKYKLKIAKDNLKVIKNSNLQFYNYYDNIIKDFDFIYNKLIVEFVNTDKIQSDEELISEILKFLNYAIETLNNGNLYCEIKKQAMKQYLNEVKKLQRLAGLLKENISEGNEDSIEENDYFKKRRRDDAAYYGTKPASNQAKIKMLLKKRAEIERDMEQDAEPEGGPIADKYGDMLNKIDKQIAALRGQGEWGPEKNVNMDKDEIERRAAMISEKEKPGLWANIRAKRKRGEAPAKKGSKAFKSAVKAAKEINKNK